MPTQMSGIDLQRISRIVALREELQRKREELGGLVVEYIRLNPAVPWRKLAKHIRMDHVQLYRIAKSKGLVADKEQESATDMTEEAL
ncbi:MAG: hypothetical protein WCE53_04700 [Candidatus Acidiferrum sp.]